MNRDCRSPHHTSSYCEMCAVGQQHGHQGVGGSSQFPAEVCSDRRGASWLWVGCIPRRRCWGSQSTGAAVGWNPHPGQAELSFPPGQAVTLLPYAGEPTGSEPESTSATCEVPQGAAWAWPSGLCTDPALQPAHPSQTSQTTPASASGCDGCLHLGCVSISPSGTKSALQTTSAGLSQ